MFWTVYGLNRKIERATLSGNQRVAIITANLHWPFGIDLDRRNRIVFWVDGWLNRVECVDYHGNNRKLLFHHRPWPSFYFFGVTFFSSFLFVSGWGQSSIYRFNVNNANGGAVSNVTISEEIDGLVVYDSSRQLPGMH